QLDGRTRIEVDRSRRVVADELHPAAVAPVGVVGVIGGRTAVGLDGSEKGDRAAVRGAAVSRLDQHVTAVGRAARQGGAGAAAAVENERTGDLDVAQGCLEGHDAGRTHGLHPYPVPAGAIDYAIDVDVPGDAFGNHEGDAP